MADVPHDDVARQVKHAVERDRQLDDAEVGGEMAAVGGANADQRLAYLTRQQIEFGAVEPLHVG